MFSELSSIHSIEKDISKSDTLDILPAVGEYHVLSLGNDYPVAVSTLGSVDLASKISELQQQGLSIVGKTETENIGIEKIIKNVLAVPSIKYLILCGKDSEGHYSGNTLLSLFENGVDHSMRVINCKGKKPILSNTTSEQIKAFRSQIEVVDMIECEDLSKISEKIKELSEKAKFRYDQNCTEDNRKLIVESVEVIEVIEKDANKVKLDKAGYFVIVPKANHTILVEHYNYENQLIRIIKGENARNIYWTIIENDWVTEMSHAAYLGKELTKAELSIQLGFKYIQDKA